MNNTTKAVGRRQSNFELLRIIAMLMVLTVHADFAANGNPDWMTICAEPLPSFARVFIEAMAIVCVNVFVMISGWFGIRPTVKGLCNFVFQCVFFYVAIFVVMMCAGRMEFSWQRLFDSVLLINSNWFITSYIGLFILAPVLNAYIEKSSARGLGLVIVAFYVFQTVFGFATATAKFIAQGYSAFSFIGLYLLARWLRLYGQNLLRYGAAAYWAGVALVTANYYVVAGTPLAVPVMVYDSPFVVLASAGLLMWFARIKMGCVPAINTVAQSAFAVFLIHTDPTVYAPFFRSWMQTLYAGFDGLACIGVMFVALLAIFAASVVADQPRKWLWSLISRSL